MGREIRKVPPNWNHPIDKAGNYIPMYDQDYRPFFLEEPIWFQVYETVSEGTPVTPSFSTKIQLVDYLIKNGDFWDQKRGNGGWSYESAVRFVESEWAPSEEVKND